MNSSKYMDKQITDLSRPPIPTFFDDDEQQQQELHHDQVFHFRPIRSVHSHAKLSDGIHLSGWSSMDQHSTKFSDDKVGIFSNVELISRIDEKLKEHADILLHSVECLSARLSQMESRTRQVENNFDDLKESIEFNHGRTDRRLRELENILIEVHGGIKDLRDKQEIAETQLQLAKLCVSKDDSQVEKQNNAAQSSLGTAALSSVSQQSNQQLPFPIACPQQVLSLSSNTKELPLQNPPLTKPAAAEPKYPTPSASHFPTISATAPQLSWQSLTNFIPSIPLASHQQYVLPPHQSQPLNIHQPYQPPHRPQNSHLPQLPQVQSSFTVVSPQVPSQHHEVPYVPSQGIRRSSQPQDRALPSQLFNVGSTDPFANLHYPVCTSANPPPQGYTNIVDFYRYIAPIQNGSSTMKPVQPSQPPPVSNGETSFTKLPTARILPHAIPTASSVDRGSSSGEVGNRVPVDDVIDNVVAMGFRRDLVRATVKKLTENGQSVDLNIVLDTLMNSG